MATVSSEVRMAELRWEEEPLCNLCASWVPEIPYRSKAKEAARRSGETSQAAILYAFMCERLAVRCKETRRLRCCGWTWSAVLQGATPSSVVFACVRTFLTLRTALL